MGEARRLLPEERVPQLVEGTDIRAHDVAGPDAFVYSCVDGVLNVEDIADVTVLSHDQAIASIERLIALGLVAWIAESSSSAPPETELSTSLAIDEAFQRQIHETFHRSGKQNHYEILGVEMDARRSEIRNAYFAISKTFHPDAYFGKELGEYKAKMEVIFRRATDAYEALGRSKKREAYDRYLRQSKAASSAEQQMGRVEERAKAMEEALSKGAVAERQAQLVEASTPESKPSAPRQKPAATAPKIAPGSPEHQRMMRKRELLERKLGGRSRRPAKTSSSSQSVPSPSVRVGAQTALRDLTRSLKQTAALTGGVDRAQNHLRAARAAEADGDLAAAATALRMAIALDRSDATLLNEYERVNAQLRVQLLDIHREQARYEEQNSMWSAASISWSKVTEAAPDDPVAPRRAAMALLAAGGDLRKARDFAIRSLELKGDALDTRVLLARIYIEAGMENSAAKELEEAAKLDPSHEMVKNLKEQLKG